MAKWELITEVKDAGYYIGWKRVHPEIHMPEPMEPMSKTSLVQIGGREGDYVVRGLTYSHGIFPDSKYYGYGGHSGLCLFDESYRYASLEDAQKKADELKKRIAELFDKTSRSDELGTLVPRPPKKKKTVRHKVKSAPWPASLGGMR